MAFLEAWRWQKGQRFLEAAHLAFDNQQAETCVSRAYYAAFHHIALLLQEKAGVARRRWDHIELQKELRRCFCDKGYLFDKKDARDLAYMLKERIEADYMDSLFNEARASRSLNLAENLCRKILEVVEGD